MASLLYPRPLRVGGNSVSTENLVGIKGSVDLEGKAAAFHVKFANDMSMRAEIPFQIMPAVMAELRTASATMLRRQQLRLDRGAEALLELCEAALRPAHVEVLIDPRTQDRLIVHQFFDHSPIAFRVTALELHTNMAYVAARAARLLH